MNVPVGKIEYFCIEACDKVTMELLPGLGNSADARHMVGGLWLRHAPAGTGKGLLWHAHLRTLGVKLASANRGVLVEDISIEGNAIG